MATKTNARSSWSLLLIKRFGILLPPVLMERSGGGAGRWECIWFGDLDAGPGRTRLQGEPFSLCSTAGAPGTYQHMRRVDLTGPSTPWNQSSTSFPDAFFSPVSS